MERADAAAGELERHYGRILDVDRSTAHVARKPGDLPDPIARDVLDQVEGVGAGEGEAAHVADVEHPRRRADCRVLVDDGRVLDRHLPAGEVDQASAVGGVPVVQR